MARWLLTTVLFIGQAFVVYLAVGLIAFSAGGSPEIVYRAGIAANAALAPVFGGSAFLAALAGAAFLAAILTALFLTARRWADRLTHTPSP